MTFARQQHRPPNPDKPEPYRVVLGALPPDPRDLPLTASKQQQETESRTGPGGGPASAPMAGQRSGCVPAEHYPLTDDSSIIARERKTRPLEKITVAVGNHNS
jgi:hypothetical protein